MHRTSLIVFAVVLIAAAAAGWLLIHGETASDPADERTTANAGTPPPPTSDPSSQTTLSTPPMALPIHQRDTRGLPPVDAPLRESLHALRAAAAAGNATAACRLALAAMDCWREQQTRRPAGRSAVDIANAESGRAYMAAALQRRVQQNPEVLRRYAVAKAHEIEQSFAREDAMSGVRARHCEGAPLVDSGEVATLLRQAAEAGQPEAVAAYAHGRWLEAIVAINAARTPAQTPLALELFRDPTFLAWRRDAAAFHTAGLEAGLLPVIEMEAIPNRVSWLDQVVVRDRVRQAAAVRTLAALVGSSAPPSTATLGLGAQEALEADRLSQRWIDAARVREARAGTARISADLVSAAPTVHACD